MEVFELGKNKKQVLLDGELDIKETTILENIEGEIFVEIVKKIEKINFERFEKCKKEVNTIAMSGLLYHYIKYLADKRKMCLDNFIENNIKQIFGLNIIIRDDYEINQIDIYRDITKEI